MIAVITVGAAVAVVWLDSIASSGGSGPWTYAGFILAMFASTGVGLLLATRRRANPIGWLLLANGLVLTASGLAEAYANYAVLAEPDAPPAERWAVLVSERGWPLLFVCITAIAWIFPDGRLPSPRWRPFAAAATASFAILIAASAFSADHYGARFADISSPLPRLPALLVGIPFLIGGLGALASLVAGAVAVRVRMRRASGVGRQQLKWLAFTAVLIPASVVLCTVESVIVGEPGTATVIALMAVMTAIPVAIGVAVMRYRLFDIDRLINRTLVYAALSAGLAAVYAAVALSLGVAIGSGSRIVTAGATLAAALVFGPLRRRAQLVVDQRVDRARYEGVRTVRRFLEDLREGRAAPEATEAVLAEALADPELELLFCVSPDDRHVDSAGRLVTRIGGPGRALTPVRRGALPLATVVHDANLGERPDLLEGVIGAAGLAIEIARLRVEVRRQLAEVEQSRARIVTAGYEERRRMERDLHDGAQQRLVSIGLALRHVQTQLPSGSRPAQTLDATVTEISQAIHELRELARGVRPAGLDHGLGQALRDLAARSRLRTSVDVTQERFDETIETAAYFVASEALVNAAKHAEASRVVLTAVRRNGSLVVSVDDDGVGGAVASERSGLSGITDRVAALGGRVTVRSPLGQGTVVTAELPCGS